MKNYRKIKYVALSGCLVLGATLTSCTDWLTLYPMNKIVEENFWEDKRDLESVRNAAYVNMTSGACMDRYMVWGELRSGNFKKNTSLEANIQDVWEHSMKPTNSYADWSSFYKTINYCNKVLEHGPEILEKDLSFSEGEWIQMRAEMIALRALNYFYLLRTFDEVPMVFKAINDDDEVKALAATPQVVLLDSLINQMETVIQNDDAILPVNYGNASDNKGLITRQAFHTILADLYLWRGSYYEGIGESAKATSSYQACDERCFSVLKMIADSYKDVNQEGSSSSSFAAIEVDDTTLTVPFCQNEGTDGVGLREGANAYNAIFGEKNSLESIFELQFDGVTNSNSLIPNFYRKESDRGSFLPSSNITALSDKADDRNNSALFSKTDLRRWTTIQPFNKNEFAIIKYAANSIDQKALKDNSATDNNREPSYSLRSTSNANWIFYRMSDVLLMKAEALCMLGKETDLLKAFKLVKIVNDRSNPYADTNPEKDEMLKEDEYIIRNENKVIQIEPSKNNLEQLILRERNREFYGEGKRWFDLLRYALRRAEKLDDSQNQGGQDGQKEQTTFGPQEACKIFSLGYDGTYANAIKNKYKKNMKVMYFPYAESEIKANSLLVQNPVWNDQNTIQKN